MSRNFKFGVKSLLLMFISIAAYATDGWQSNTVMVNQHKLHYYQGGSGTPLVLLTGLGTTTNFWNKSFVSCLAKKHSVYLFDYWGINTDENVAGNTSVSAMAEDSYGLIQALHLVKPSVVGWSMGGGVAQQLSFAHMADLGKMVLIAPTGIDNHYPESGRKMVAKKTGGDASGDKAAASKPVLAKSSDDILNSVFAFNLYGYSAKDLNQYKNDLFSPQGKLFPARQIAVNQRNAINAWISNPDTKQGIKNAQGSYLFLIPNQDKALDPVKTTLDAGQYLHATVVKFDHSGHNLSMQEPDKACAQIEGFINQ